MNFPRMIRRSVLAAAFAMTAAGVAAQQDRAGIAFPSGLNWQTMEFASFNFRPKQYGSQAVRAQADAIWHKTIASFPENTLRSARGFYPAFVLIKSYTDAGYRYTFTILSAAHAAYPLCEDPPNSSDPRTPIYDVCPLRVVIENTASGRQAVQDFPRYCSLQGMDEDTPASENHTEMAFDKETRRAYFRIVQYGRPVPSCDRAVQLP